MALKHLLSDTDHTKGWDNRFGTAVHIGFVSKIECNEKRASVRVIMPDKVDRNGTALNTKPIPVLQIASLAKRQFAVPRLGDMVALVKMAHGTSSYVVIGSFYTKKNPPPVTDPKLDYVIYDEGSTMQFDANDGKGEQTWKLKGKVTWDNEKDWSCQFKEAILIESKEQGITVKADEAVVVESTAAGVTIKAPSGTVTVEASQITLKGPLRIEGDITHIGNMNTSGVHVDANGTHHTT